MTITPEMESIDIHARLIKEGYLIKRDCGRWQITEPNSRAMPQQARGIRNMSEAAVFADAVEKIRFVIGGGK